MNFMRPMLHDKAFRFGAFRFHRCSFNRRSRLNRRNTNRLWQLGHADRGGRNRLDHGYVRRCLRRCVSSRFRLDRFSSRREIAAFIDIRIEHARLSAFGFGVAFAFRNIGGLIGRHAFFIAITASTTTTTTATTTLFTFTCCARLIGLQRFGSAVLLRFLTRLSVFRQLRHYRFALRQRFDGGFRLWLAAFASFGAIPTLPTLTAIGSFSTFRCAFTVLARFTRFPWLAHFTLLAGFTAFTSLTRLATFACFTRFAAFTSTTRFARLACFLRFPFFTTRVLTATGRTRRARCGRCRSRCAIARSSTTTTIAVPVTTLARTLRTFATRRACRRGRCDRRGRRLNFRLDAEQIL
jgi:hypothetical protein